MTTVVTAPEVTTEATVEETTAPIVETPASAASKEPELDPKAPATEKETAYGRQLRRREAELVARQSRFAGERTTVAGEKAAIAKDRAAIESAKAELETLKKELHDDPLAFAVKHKGWREEDLARRFLGGNKPSAQEAEQRREQTFRDELAARDAQIAAVQAKVDAREKAEQEAAQKAQSDAKNAEVIANFTAHATKLAATCPLAAKAITADPEEAIPACNVLAQRLRAANPTLSGAPLWTAVLTHYNAHLAKISGVTPAPTQGSESTKKTEKPGAQVNSADAAKSGTTAPTLTGKKAAERSVIATEDDPLMLQLTDPKAYRELTERKITEALAKRKAAQTA